MSFEVQTMSEARVTSDGDTRSREAELKAVACETLCERNWTSTGPKVTGSVPISCVSCLAISNPTSHCAALKELTSALIWSYSLGRRAKAYRYLLTEKIPLHLEILIDH